MGAYDEDASVLTCPAETQPTLVPTTSKVEYGGGYGFNLDLTSGQGGAVWLKAVATAPVGASTISIVSQSEFVNIWDSAEPLVGPAVEGWVFDRNNFSATALTGDGIERRPQLERHPSDSGNLLFHDGYAAGFQRDDITVDLVRWDNKIN